MTRKECTIEQTLEWREMREWGRERYHTYLKRCLCFITNCQLRPLHAHCTNCMAPPMALHVEIPSTSTQEERREREIHWDIYREIAWWPDTQHFKCAKRTIERKIFVRNKNCWLKSETMEKWFDNFNLKFMILCLTKIFSCTTQHNLH